MKILWKKDDKGEVKEERKQSEETWTGIKKSILDWLIDRMKNEEENDRNEIVWEVEINKIKLERKTQ